MEGIDPNPDNYVAGGILNTSTVLVGCLVRLEPNKQTEVSLILWCVYGWRGRQNLVALCIATIELM